MSEVENKPEVQAEIQNKQEPDHAAIINSAVTSQLKRMLPKAIEQAISALKPPEPAKTPEAEAKKDESPELAELRAAVKKLQSSNEKLTEREKRATEKARSATLHNSLSEALKGKVDAQWADIAAERLASKATFDPDDNPFLKFDDEDVSISEGVSRFLKQPENKRFLPAPKVPGNTFTAPQRSPYLPAQQDTSSNIDPLSDEYLGIATAALQARGGLIPKS